MHLDINVLSRHQCVTCQTSMCYLLDINALPARYKRVTYQTSMCYLLDINALPTRYQCIIQTSMFVGCRCPFNSKAVPCGTPLLPAKLFTGLDKSNSNKDLYLPRDLVYCPSRGSVSFIHFSIIGFMFIEMGIPTDSSVYC